MSVVVLIRFIPEPTDGTGRSALISMLELVGLFDTAPPDLPEVIVGVGGEVVISVGLAGPRTSM
jgi:hypothetical protein